MFVCLPHAGTELQLPRLQLSPPKPQPVACPSKINGQLAAAFTQAVYSNATPQVGGGRVPSMGCICPVYIMEWTSDLISVIMTNTILSTLK